MTEAQAPQPTTPDTSELKQGRGLYIAAILAFVLVAAYFFFQARQTQSVNDGELLKIKKEKANLQAQFEELKRKEILDQQARSMARSKLLDAKLKGDAARAPIDELRKETQAWTTLYLSLLQRERGKGLAAHPASLEQFAALGKGPLPSTDLPDQLSQSLDPLPQPINTGLEANTPDAPLHKDTLPAIADIQDRATKALEPLTAKRPA